MKQNIALECINLGKCYRSYQRPFHRVLDLLDVPATGGPEGKRYTENWAIRGFDLTLQKGERLGIIGRNGAGKSTLLQLICGRLQSSEGSFTVNGRIQALLELGTGFYPEFNCRDNIRASLAVADVPEKEIHRLEEEIIEFAELWDVAEQPVRTYSTGMYTRLAFATATALKPDILVIDEVFHAGDATFVGKSSERMRQLTENDGATVLFVTHSLAMMERFCTRAILLEKGRVITEGTSLDVSRYYSARIREEEEINLMARQGKLRKRSLLAAGITNPDCELLCRLSVPPATSSEGCRIYSIQLESDLHPPVELPLSDTEQEKKTASQGRLIVDPDHLDWGPSQHDSSGALYRNCGGNQGQTGNAPFAFHLSTDVSVQQSKLTLSYWLAKEQNLILEVFHQGKFRLIGNVSGEGQRQQISFSLPALQQGKQPPPGVPADARYGDGICQIHNFGIRGTEGREKRIFITGEDMTAWFQVDFLQPQTTFVATLCIYHIDTTPMCQVFMPSNEIDIANGPDHLEFTVDFSPLRFGEGEYTVTLAVYQECDMADAQENHAHCVLDRALTFRIEQPEGIRKGFGRFLHPVRWQAHPLRQTNEIL